MPLIAHDDFCNPEARASICTSIPEEQMQPKHELIMSFIVMFGARLQKHFVLLFLVVFAKHCQTS